MRNLAGVVRFLFLSSTASGGEFSKEIDKCVNNMVREKAYEIHWSEKRKAKEGFEKGCRRYVPMVCRDRDSKACKDLLGESRPPVR